MRLFYTFVMMACFSSTLGAEIPLEFIKKELVQGGYVIAKTQPETQVFFANHKVVVNHRGYFVIGFGRDAKTNQLLRLQHGKNVRKVPLMITRREWKTERIDNLPEQKVSPKSPEILQRIRKEVQLVKQARSMVSQQNAFLQTFKAPAQGRISGVYGSQRILNGIPKRPHYGIDIAAAKGTPVLTPADGIVRLVAEDMYYSGGTLIIDHGLGLSSTMIHLHSINVKEGDLVKQGQKVATVGSTGRSTGPHLDWRINWFNQRLDPTLFVSSRALMSTSQ